MRRTILCLVALQFTVCGFVAHARDAASQPPSRIYGELFERVQNEKLFVDSKTFADAAPKTTAEEVRRRYAEQKTGPGFVLADFVKENFVIPGAAASDFRTAPREEVRAHIDRLWDALTRQPPAARGLADGDSLLPLSTRYVVPGGRFREMYYWDSYFTMVGLQTSGRHDLVADMVQNFAGLIDDYGHIPNGARTYYLGRSQPPFFAAMVQLQASHDGVQALIRRLPQLQREYAFWMEGGKQLAPGAAHRRVVRLPDGSVLNRYWDDLAIPRDESYREDIATARESGRPPDEVYRDLRAAAESGWDFSSRWFADGKTLATIRTTDYLPVDLNSLLYQLEVTIASACKASDRRDCTREFMDYAIARKKSMLRLMWDAGRGAFVDYDWRNQRKAARVNAATVFPLFSGITDKTTAHRVAATVRTTLLMPHGLATTLDASGQQWDAPNGWAPLQWIAIDGLRRNGEPELAADIARRWVAENTRVYCRTGKLVEKYNVGDPRSSDGGEGAGGEYPVQDGFGWTNGVLIRLLEIYPALARPKYEFTGGGC